MTSSAAGPVAVLVALVGASACVPDDWKSPSPVDAGAADVASPADVACPVAAPTRCAGVCVDPRTDVAHCGACGTRCGDFPGGAAACVAGACLAPPRPVAPLSTATVTSRRPTLHWALPVGDGAHVELCRDRALTVGCVAFDAAGSSGRPAADLDPGVWFWRLSARVAGTTTTAAGPIWQFDVGARSAPLDLSWGSTLDVNGDGYTDVAVGTELMTAEQPSPTVRVHLGGAGATALRAEPIELEGFAGSNFGRSVARAGDVNGDGYADLVVGASLSNTTYVYLGGATPFLEERITLSGPADSATFGGAVAGAGDLNGDGYGDLLVSAMGSQTVYLYLGGAGAGALRAPPITLTGPDGSRAFGAGVAGVGDLNGDGHADVVIGAGAFGRAYVYFGSGGANPLGAPPTTLMGDPVARFGNGVEAAGDLNGDGYADLIVVAYVASSVYVYFGGSGESALSETPMRFMGPGFNGGFSAGDVNRDGYGDVAFIGGDAGLAHIYLGAPDAVPRSTTTIDVRAPSGSAYFGSAGASAGDVNGDGYSDFTVGAFLSSTAYVYLGGVGSPPFQATPITLIGPRGTRYGVAVARAGRRDRCRGVSGG